MKLEYHNIKNQGKFILTTFKCDPSLSLLKEKEFYKVIWCQENDSELIIDGYRETLKAGQMLFCTPLHVVEISDQNPQLLAYAFNREFYCIQENDAEVSCRGMLFYGSSQVPIIDLNNRHSSIFKAIHTLLIEEFKVHDSIQGEMLRCLLKRMLITATRLFKDTGYTSGMSVKQTELIRSFHILVEQHYKEKHQVADYAHLLNKSPKTLSNFFKIHNAPSPLRIINDRITAQAKRLLLYSDKTAEEIAYELGYLEPSHFSKFFKKQTGVSPLTFRKQ